MKVVDLVTHTSGLTYGFMMRTSVDAAYRKLKVNDFQTPGGLDTMIEQLPTLPLEFSPGTAWNYSVSIDVMGYLVQKLSGHELRRVPAHAAVRAAGHDRHRLLLSAGEDRPLRLLLPAREQGGGLKVQDDAQKSTYAAPPALESGGGGLVSTAHDYMRFCRMMLHGGALDGVQILSPKTVALFSLNHLPDGQELAAMAPPGAFSEAGYSRHRLLDRLRGQRRRRQDPPARHARRILLGRRGLDRVLDRSEGGAGGGVHDPGDGHRRAPDPAPRPAHPGLFGDR